MSITLREKLAKLAPEERAAVESRAAEILAEVTTLRELRRHRGLTQEALARRLGMRQPNVAKLEQRSDMLISTLRNVVEEMGGELDLVVRLPDQPPVHLQGLGDLRDGPEKAEREPAPSPDRRAVRPIPSSSSR